MEFSDVLMVVFTGVVAVSTVVYTYMTSGLLKETRRARQDQLEPNIIAYFRRPYIPVDTVSVIVVKNIGPDVAYQITFELSPALQQFVGQCTSTRDQWFDRPVPVLGPNEGRVCFQGESSTKLVELDSSGFWIKASYKTPRGRVRTNQIWLDPMTEFGDLPYDENPSRRIAHTLESIDRTLRDAVTTSNGFVPMSRIS